MNTPDDATSLPRLVSTVPAEVLAKVGETVASAAERLQNGWPEMPHDAAAEAARLDELGLQLQALARVLAGHGPAAPEALDLGMALLQARAEWHRELARRGVTLVGPHHDWIVQGSAGVLKQLLDLAIGHAASLGRQVVVDIGRQRWPGHVSLTFTVTDGGEAPFALRDGDDLHWDLLQLLAGHAGLRCERVVQALGVQLALGFPTAMDAPERLRPAPRGRRRAAPQPPAEHDDFAATDPMTAQLAPEDEHGPVPPASASLPTGSHVLLLEPHEPTRRLAARLMAAAGLVVTAAVPTVAQARDAIGSTPPEWLVTGIGVGDPSVAPLLADLRARRPTLRVLELADSDLVYSTLVPADQAPARVARGDIENALLPALAQPPDRAR